MLRKTDPGFWSVIFCFSFKDGGLTNLEEKNMSKHDEKVIHFVLLILSEVN